MRFFPGCQCCENCNWFSDDFNRTNSTDLGSGWTEVSGDSSISASALSVPASGLVATTATNPAGSAMTASVGVTLASAGHAARLVVCYTDSNNYAYFEAARGTPGTVKLVNVVSGSHNTLVSDSTMTVGSSLTLKLCYSLGYLYGGFTGMTTNKWLVAAASLSGNKAGAATPAGNSATFDDFIARQVSAECGRCIIPYDGVGSCCGSPHGGPDVPTVRSVVITGVHADVNGTHFLPLVDANASTLNTPYTCYGCVWGTNLASPGDVQVRQSNSAFCVEVRMAVTGGSPFALYNAEHTPAGHCVRTLTECSYSGSCVTIPVPGGATVKTQCLV